MRIGFVFLRLNILYELELIDSNPAEGIILLGGKYFGKLDFIYDFITGNINCIKCDICLC